MLHNFIIIGAMKCGPISIDYYLSQHPEVFMSSPENIYYFSADKNYNMELPYYESYFNGADEYKAVGEASDDYTKALMRKNEVASERIKEILPNVKLIYIVRHPLRQIESAWLQRCADSSEVLPFNEAVMKSKYQYIQTANYTQMLEPYIKRFKQEQILVLFTEDLKKDPIGVLGSCFNFLGVDNSIDNTDLTPHNVSFDKPYDRSFTKIFRKNKYIVKMAQGSPRPLKYLFKKFFTQKKKLRPQWDSETLNYVIDEIWDDSLGFLRKHNKNDTFWKLDEYR